MISGSTFFVTGATGFLGGFITAELIRRKARVTAGVRPGRRSSPQQRIQRLMDYFDLEPEDSLNVVEADLTLPNMGLSGVKADLLRNEMQHVFHCAGDTSFSSRHAERLHRVNVQGLENVFRTLGEFRSFHYMSTAYACGKKEGVCREEMDANTLFHNEYERSKYLAERKLKELCEEFGTELTIYRPSIVYGDSETGRSLGFTALYNPVRILVFIRNTCRRDILKSDGRRSAELGVTMDGDGRFAFPLEILDEGGGMNLIPVDHLVRSVFAIMESGGNGIYNIVNGMNDPLEKLVRLIENMFEIEGIRTVHEKKASGRNPLQSLVDRYMEPYLPYMSDGRVFDDSRAAPLLEKAGISCPDLTQDIFQRCMSYAVEKEWGAGLAI